MATQKDIGTAQVLLMRLEQQRLPYALKMKQRVDKGELLTDYDRKFLKQMAEDARHIPALIDKLPQYKPLVEQISSLYEQITARALENEKNQPKV